MTFDENVYRYQESMTAQQIRSSVYRTRRPKFYDRFHPGVVIGAALMLGIVIVAVGAFVAFG